MSIRCNKKINSKSAKNPREQIMGICSGTLRNMKGKTKVMGRGIILRKRLLQCNSCGDRIGSYEIREDSLLELMRIVDNISDFIGSNFSRNIRAGLLGKKEKTNNL